VARLFLISPFLVVIPAQPAQQVRQAQPERQVPTEPTEQRQPSPLAQFQLAHPDPVQLLPIQAVLPLLSLIFQSRRVQRVRQAQRVQLVLRALMVLMVLMARLQPLLLALSALVALAQVQRSQIVARHPLQFLTLLFRKVLRVLLGLMALTVLMASAYLLAAQPVRF
jgi:hypothetical protein